MFQLVTILEEAHHSLIVVEHDPMLYEDAQEMTEYISKALKQTSYEADGAAVPLWNIDPFSEDMTNLADRFFYFEEGTRGMLKSNCQNMAKDEGSADAGGVYVIRVSLDGLDNHLDIINPKPLELQASKRSWPSCIAFRSGRWRI